MTSEDVNNAIGFLEDLKKHKAWINMDCADAYLDIAIKVLNTGEIYMTGEDYNLFLEGYKDGMKDYKSIAEENKALRLLLDWVLECDSFGYDNIPEEYEKYKDQLKDMRYTEGLIYIAKQTIKEQENQEKSDPVGIESKVRLIDADVLKKAVNTFYDNRFNGLVPNELIEYAKAVDNLIDNFPTVDAIVNTIEVRPQGKWKITRLQNNFDDVYCPFCNARPTRSEYGYYLLDKFCHDCGARLEGYIGDENK